MELDRLEPLYLERHQMPKALFMASKTQAQRVSPASDISLRTFQLLLQTFGLGFLSPCLVSYVTSQ